MTERILVLSNPNWSEKGFWLLSEETDIYFHPLHLQALPNGINTDAIFPVSDLLSFEDIAPSALTGLSGIKENEVAQLSPTVLVGGENFGCGSAREHAPISLQQAGISLIIASSFNRTFRENCTNLGIFTSTDLQLIEKLLAGEEIPREEILAEFKEIERDILEKGGLFTYNQARLERKIKPPKIETQSRLMTVAEKIIAQHLKERQENAEEEIYLKPGDQTFIPLDIRMSYEIFTPLMAKLLADNALGYPINDPSSILLFADHFIAQCESNSQVAALLETQRNFAQAHGMHLYENKGAAAAGICHNLMIEEHLLPGQLGAGTDSHSSMWGALGALGIPVGATAMANSFLTKDVLIKMPESVKVTFKGELAEGYSAKDVILKLISTLSLEVMQGKIIEFHTEDLNWPVDELSVLTNQVPEGGAKTAIAIPNESVIRYLMEERGLSREKVEKMIVKPDPKAEYSAKFEVDLSKIEPMVALPGSPRNAIPISQLSERPRINKAFIGSCVGGKLEDLKATAAVLKDKQIASSVTLVIQPASQKIYQQAKQMGLIEIFEKAGAIVAGVNCGGCIGQGPSRVEGGEVGISASTRNYPGRMGPGDVYLASPATVASSAIAGKICSLKEI